MKEINCTLCGSPSKKVLLVKEGLNISKCNKCGFVYTSSRKGQNFQNKIYQDKYFHIEDFKEKEKIGYRSYLKDRDYHKFYFGKKINLIKKFKTTGKILDIGCALGFFMETAKESGFDPFGIDVSKYAISYAKKRFPTKVFCTTIDKTDFKKGSFDVVALFQTIEHLNDPLSLLNKTNLLLKKDGLVVITCPNHGSLLRKIMGKFWFEYKPVEHLNFFDSKSINTLLEKSGFKVKFLGGDVFYYPLNYIFERLSYYSPFFALKRMFNFVYVLSKKMIVKDLKIPLPLGGIIIIAAKK